MAPVIVCSGCGLSLRVPEGAMSLVCCPVCMERIDANSLLLHQSRRDWDTDTKGPPPLPLPPLVELRRILRDKTAQLEIVEDAHSQFADQVRALAAERARLYRRRTFRSELAAPTTAILTIAFGLTLAIAVAVFAVFLDKVALAALLAFTTLCLTALAVVGWHHHRDDWREKAGLLDASIARQHACVEEAEIQRKIAQQRLEHAHREADTARGQVKVAERSLLQKDWDAMNGHSFEAFLADVFEAWGYRVQVTKGSGDHGVDLVVEIDHVRIAIQAKRWNNGVGNKAVQEVFLGKKIYACDHCAVITNSSFTKSARKAARVANCRLLAGRDIKALITGELRLDDLFPS